MTGKGWKISIALGVILAVGFVSKSLLFKPDAFSPSQSGPTPNRSRGESLTQRSQPSGLPPCFFLQPASKKEQNISDCLLLVPGKQEVETFEVNLRTGLLVLIKTDVFLADTLPIVFTRIFRPWSNWSSVWEIPAAHVYDIYPTGSRYPYTYMDLNLPDGERLHYSRISPGTGYADAVYAHTGTRTAFYGSQIKWNGNGWALTLRDGTVYLFPEAYNATRPAQGALVGVRDQFDNSLRLSRDAAGNLIKITTPRGRWVEFSYATNNIREIKDHQGHVVQYGYDAYGRLLKMINFDGQITQYTYDNFNRLLTIKDPRGTIVLKNEYDPNGRVLKQTQADGRSYSFHYKTNEYGNILQTDVVDPRGKVTRVTFSGSTYAVTKLRSPSPDH